MEILPPKPKFQILSVRLKGKLKAAGLLFLFHLIGQEDKASYSFFAHSIRDKNPSGEVIRQKKGLDLVAQDSPGSMCCESVHKFHCPLERGTEVTW